MSKRESNAEGLRAESSSRGTLQTMAEFCELQGIKATAKRVFRSPIQEANDDWGPNARHWDVFFTRGDQAEMTVRFHQGEAHTEPPTVHEVLDCLAMDAAGYENARGFENWCDEYGYNTDSRKAEKTYRAVESQTARLKSFLTPAQYEVALWEVSHD